FGTITELLVLPEYQRRGIGSHLLQLAREHTPTMLFFGAQPGVEAFYEKNGCTRGFPSFVIEKKR
ncbi:MAG: GNAT family N-acetyltransferase, partial [Eggerthellaceae bacterium]|nr:GNAT family N-acetyltransferase [Eggerthellaceae bacterium]